jgi:hypothetical protein
MRKEKTIKLQLIRTLSDPDIMIREFHVSIGTKQIPKSRYDKDISDGWLESELTGHSTYIIDIYKEPKKDAEKV